MMSSNELFALAIAKCDTSRGAPMGRFSDPVHNFDQGKGHKPIFCRKVNLDSGGYDKGCAYWGFPCDLYVIMQQYNNPLNHITFNTISQNAFMFTRAKSRKDALKELTD